MSNCIVQNDKIFLNKIFVPPSKSQTIRAFLFASLSIGKCTIKNPLISADTKAMLKACETLGAKVSVLDDVVSIEGIGDYFPTSLKTIDAKNSGLILRFFPAIFALTNTPLIITGDTSIQTNRILHPLLDGLSQLGAGCFCFKKQGFAPAYIKGPISPGVLEVEGKDSQPISALLIALSLLKGRSELFVKDPGETEWVDLTLDWFAKMSLQVKKHSISHFSIYGHGVIKPFECRICGDFSAAFYPIAIALITNQEIEISYLDFEEKQPDKAFLSIVQKMGAKITVNGEGQTLTIHKDSFLKGCKIDVESCVDSISILAVLACFAEGKTTIFNAEIARSKECDRIFSICSELKKMGAKIEETQDGLIVEKSQLMGTKVHSYQDHRMVFALTCAAVGALGETEIENIDCIEKTNPYFFQEMKKIGVGSLIQ